MIDILLIGAGGHSKSCIDVIETGNIFNICGFVDQRKFVVLEMEQFLKLLSQTAHLIKQLNLL